MKVGSQAYLMRLKAKLDSSTATVSDLNKQIKSLEKKIGKLELKVGINQSSQKGFQNLNKQLKSLKVDLEDFSKVSTTINKGLGTTTDKLVDNNGRVLTIIRKIGDESNRAKVKLVEATQQTSKWGDAFEKAFRAFTTYHLIARALQVGIDGIKDMVENVEELDKSLTELKKVTDLEGESLELFVQRAFDAGEGVAKTGREMVEAATEFAKAGYDENMILQLGTVANMYTNIADEEVSAADAAGFIIAQLKAFNLEAKDTNTTLANSQHIIDAVNEVANNFAVSSADIAENLGKSSAVMANAGNSLEETIGLLTAGTEITRNASKVSVGLKTLTLRLQGMNDEGEESLELIASNEALFRKLGLSLYDADGSLKNTYQILKDLSEVYPSLNAEMKAYVTETLAGKHQSQILAAILKNFSTAIEATETALNSEGSAVKENEKVLDSIEGRIKNLKRAFEGLSQSFIKSADIKLVVDSLALLVKTLNSNIGQTTIRAAAFFAVFQAGRRIIPIVVENFQKFHKTLKDSVGSFAGVKSSFNSLINMSKLLNIQENINNRTVKKSCLALNALGISTDGVTKKKQLQKLVNQELAASEAALSLALGAAAIALSVGMTIYNKIQEYKQKQIEANQDLISTTLESIKAHKEEAQELEDLIKQYKELHDNKKLGDNEDTKALQESINKLLEDRKETVDLINGSYENQLKILKNITEEIDTMSKSELERAKIAANEELKRVNKESGNNLYGILNQYQLEAKTPNYYKFDEMGVEKKIEELTKLRDYLQKEYLDKEKNYSEKQRTIISQHLNEVEKNLEALTKAKEESEKINEQLQKIEDKRIVREDYKISSTSSKEDVESFIKSVKESNKYSDEQKVRLLEIAKGVLPEYSKELQTVIDDLNGICSVEDLLNDTQYGVVTSFEAIDKVLDSVQSAYDTLKTAIEEYNKQGYISIDTLQSLSSLGWEYLQYLFDENGQLNVNEQAMRKLAIAQLQKMQATALDESLNYAKKLAEEGTSADNTATKINNLRNAIINMNEEKAKSIALDMLGDDKEAYAAWEENYKQVSGYIKQIQNTINKISKGTGVISSASKASSSSTKKTKEWWEEQLSALKDQFNYNEITIEQYISSLQKLLGKVKKGTEAYRKINEELGKQKLNQIQDAYKRGTISLDEYIKKLKALIKTYKEGSQAWLDIADKIKSGLQEKANKQKSDLDTAEKAALGLIDEEIEKIKKLKEEKEKELDAEIEAKKKSNDETERAIELARLQEALENAKREKTKRVWREGLGKKSAEYKDNYIGQMLEIVKTEVRLNLRKCVHG